MCSGDPHCITVHGDSGHAQIWYPVQAPRDSGAHFAVCDNNMRTNTRGRFLTVLAPAVSIPAAVAVAPVPGRPEPQGRLKSKDQAVGFILQLVLKTCCETSDKLQPFPDC